MIKLPFWPPIHKFLVANQKLIRNLFFISYLVGFAIIGLGFYLFPTDLKTYILFAEIGKKVGTLSLLAFLTTLMPGIFQRFKILPLFSASIVLFRRQIGILMYVLALVHSSLVSLIPLIMSGEFGLSNLSSHEMLGFIAVLILFPVWITSNDLSQNNMGKLWKAVQRLTYVAIIFIFLHVASVEMTGALIMAVVAILEILSWIKVWFFKSKITQSVNQPPGSPDVSNNRV